MRHWLRICAGAAAWLAAAGLAGCGKTDQGVTPGPGQVALVTQALDFELNAPARQVRTSLIQANANKVIYPQELSIPGEDSDTPVDWWVYDRGLLHLDGFNMYGVAHFTLSDKGQAFVSAPPPHWLASAFQGSPQVSCAGGGTWTSCTVAAVASVHMTPAGADLLRSATIAPQSFDAHLEYGPGGWRVEDLHLASGADPSRLASRAMFGDAAAVAKARYQFGVAMNHLYEHRR